MKISLDWLNSYLDRPADACEVEAVMTEAGFPLEGQQTVTLAEGSSDTMLDLEVTSNRGDCLSHVGIAREMAAGSGRTLEPPACEAIPASGKPAESFIQITNQASDHCGVYTARVITGVKVGPSPDWLVQRLEAIGLRPINNVVDVTNFVMMELGQPLHAFDLNKLAGGQIVIRQAVAGERFTALDHSQHTLRDNMLVIADAQRPAAVAGIMGGLESQVDEGTVDVLIESGDFDALAVRRTSRALKLGSDSSFRFERGVDPLGIDRASLRACALMLEIAGGTLAPGVVRVGAPEPAQASVTLRVSRCQALLGLSLSADEVVGLLDRLGLTATLAGDVVTCQIPSHRLDLEREVDLIEEVARSYGLGNIPVQEKIHISARPPQVSVQARDTLARVLTAHGYHETITFSFIAEKYGRAFLPDSHEAVMLAPEMRKAEPMLRPSVLASLMLCRKTNQDVGNSQVKLYETGSTWSCVQGQRTETRKLSLLCDAQEKDVALRGLRGTLDELVESLGGASATLTVDPIQASPFSEAVAVSVDGQRVGTMGLLAGSTRDLFAVQTPVAAAELEVDGLLGLYPPKRQASALPRQPGIERDLSVVVDQAVAWRDIALAVEGAAPALMESLDFVGVYRGKQIGQGRKSVTLRMRFRDPGQTLRHEQVDPQVATVLASLQSQCGAAIRA